MAATGEVGGVKSYYQAQIVAELTINQKTQNLRRLEALNARGEQTRKGDYLCSRAQ